MPFRSVSSETLWKLFLVLHLDASKVDSVESIQRENAYKDNWRDILKSMFNNRSNRLWTTVSQASFQALLSWSWERVEKSSQSYWTFSGCSKMPLTNCMPEILSPLSVQSNTFLRTILEMIRSRQPCFRCKGSVVVLIFRNGHAQNILIFLFSGGTFSILSVR